MRLGTYYYKEISAPANIEIDPEMKEFKLTEDGQILEISLKNNVIEGKLKIIKVNEKNEPIKGVEFEVLDSNKNVIQTITTNDVGVALSDKLSKGTYYYREKRRFFIYLNIFREEGR